MADLTVVGFQGTHRAAEVLNQVLDLNADWAADLHLEDAVAVYRTRDGKLRVDESMQPTSKDGAAWGGAVGALSTLTGVMLVQMAVAEASKLLLDSGERPPVYVSANVPGGFEGNLELEKRYAGRIRRTAS